MRRWGLAACVAALAFGASGCFLPAPIQPVHLIPTGGSLAFGDVTVGSSVTMTAVITDFNLPTVGITAAIGGANPFHNAEFHVVDLHEANACLDVPVLSVGQTCVLDVTFTPLFPGFVNDVGVQVSAANGPGTALRPSGNGV